MNYKELIDQSLQPHLQRDVSLVINNKIIKTGRLILFNFYDYHIEFALNCNNKIKKALIPIPFKLELNSKDNIIYFDYRLKTLYQHLSPRESNSKFYNTILEIKFK